ncbi:diguanylate cyclase (GGDEF) domain protein [[Eubacterium] yurii subsp. margaretiae ATCC 43715]|nr:diguanylate cyclase (GGDEF) domain protein [[Eubacterium] yurii subsp. margaretiae ATCC 43715]
MNFKTKKLMLINIFILTIVYAFSVFINKNIVATIASITCILLIAITTLFNMKNISKNRKYLYFLVLLYNIAYLSSTIFWLLQKYFDTKFTYLRYLKDLSYSMESFFVAIIVISVIFLNMKFMDKRQFAIDFFAVSFTVYYIARPILSSIFSDFDFSLESINTVTITLFLDTIISMAVIIIIYTFRQKFDNPIVKINITAIIIFLIVDYIYVYQKIVGIYNEDAIFDFFYIIPHVFFALSVSLESSNGGFSFKIQNEKALNYGSDKLIMYSFCILFILNIILTSTGIINRYDSFTIFTIVVIYLFLNLSHKEKLKKDELLRINKEMALELEKKISERTNELENTNHKLLNYINTDSLTGIGSRSYLTEILDSNESLEGTFVVLYMIDVIRFKNINYISGHIVADNILRTIAHTLRKEFCHDMVFRTDSNEFVILIKDKSCDVDKLEKTAKKISDSISNIELDDKIHKISVAIGCSYCDSSYNNLLKNAEYACKMAKEDFEENKNYKLYDDEISQHMLRMANIESLLKIIDYDKEFFMEFQPQFSIDGDEVLGMEALIRWNSPILGYVTPMEFIPIAENTGTIVKITKWTIEQSFRMIEKWNVTYNSNLSMSINISPKYFCMYNFIKEIANFISTTNVKPSWLDFEITEMTMINIDSSTIDTFEKLNYLGINVSLDDFGTGYSSLNYINSFKLNRLKIAKELIDTLSYQDKNSNLVHAIIKMADSLDLNTIAEGVETKKQLDILKDVGCGQIQGFYYGKPTNGKDFEEKYLISGKYSLKK